MQYPKRERPLRQVKRCQRALSRAVKGSKGGAKRWLALAKTWQRVSERERGHLHEVTADVVKRHGSRLFVEALRIRNMVKNGHLARSIHEQMWNTFMVMLVYKAVNAGGWLQKVNPRNTSQRCSGCGAMPAQKLTLADRVKVCLACGLVLDRDVNAALNVLQVGLSGLSGLSGGNIPTCSEKAEDGQVSDCPSAQNRVGHFPT